MGKRRLKIGGSEPSANYEIKNKNCKIKYMIKWRKEMFQYFLCSAIMSLDGPATNFYPTFCYICPMKFLQQTFIGYQTFLNKIYGYGTFLSLLVIFLLFDYWTFGLEIKLTLLNQSFECWSHWLLQSGLVFTKDWLNHIQHSYWHLIINCFLGCTLIWACPNLILIKN